MIRLFSAFSVLILTLFAATSAYAARYNGYKQDAKSVTETRTGMAFPVNAANAAGNLNTAQHTAGIILRGARLQDAALLQWTIRNTDKAQSLMLERSEDGVKFALLKNLENKFPGYTDAHPPRAAYYRLCVITDKGGVVYSPAIYLGADEELPADK